MSNIHHRGRDVGRHYPRAEACRGNAEGSAAGDHVEKPHSWAEVGLLLSLGSAIQIVFMWGFDRVVDSRGRKLFVVYGMTGSAPFGRCFRDPTWRALVPRGYRRLWFVVRAIAVSAIFEGSYAFIGDVAPAERESELMGMLSTVKGIGGVVGPLLLGGIATIAGYEFAFAGGSLFAVAAAGFVAKGVVESYPGPTIHQSTAVGLSVMIERMSRLVVLWYRFERVPVWWSQE